MPEVNCHRKGRKEASSALPIGICVCMQGFDAEFATKALSEPCKLYKRLSHQRKILSLSPVHSDEQDGEDGRLHRQGHERLRGLAPPEVLLADVSFSSRGQQGREAAHPQSMDRNHHDRRQQVGRGQRQNEPVEVGIRSVALVTLGMRAKLSLR